LASGTRAIYCLRDWLGALNASHTAAKHAV
jgi:hypothetical protein